MELKINKEFYDLIPNLSREEASSLIKSLRKEGCRHPIITWKGMIIDGHNRYAICKRLGIEFESVEKDDLEDEYEVQLWMIENQLARRNLPIEDRLDLAYRFKQIEAQKAKERQIDGVKIENDTLAPREAKVEDKDRNDTLAHQCAKVEDQNSQDLRITKETNAESQFTNSAPVRLREEPKGKTLESIAQKAGVSTRTAEQYDTIQRKGSEEQKEAVRKGEKKIGTVYKEIQKKENPKLQNTTSLEVTKKEESVASLESAAHENVISYTELKKIFKSEFEAKYLKDNDYKYWFVSFKPEENQLMEVTNCSDQESLIMYADCLMGVAAQQNNMTTIETARAAIKELINEFVMRPKNHERIR